MITTEMRSKPTAILLGSALLIVVVAAIGCQKSAPDNKAAFLGAPPPANTRAQIEAAKAAQAKGISARTKRSKP
jgi:predicted outer membrane protein